MLKNRYEQAASAMYQNMVAKAPSLSSLLSHHVSLYDAHDSLPTPTYRREGDQKYYGEISSETLAEVLYHAGASWNQSLLLSASELLVERLALHISDQYKQCHEQKIYDDVIGVLHRALNLHTTMLPKDALQSFVSRTHHDVAACVASITAIHNAVDALNLHDVWNKPRIISGEAINKVNTFFVLTLYNVIVTHQNTTRTRLQRNTIRTV